MRNVVPAGPSYISVTRCNRNGFLLASFIASLAADEMPDSLAEKLVVAAAVMPGLITMDKARLRRQMTPH